MHRIRHRHRRKEGQLLNKAREENKSSKNPVSFSLRLDFYLAHFFTMVKKCANDAKHFKIHKYKNRTTLYFKRPTRLTPIISFGTGRFMSSKIVGATSDKTPIG